MNKRGSHVGVIISFLIFIGMIVFLYAILAPTISVRQNNQAELNSLKFGLESNFSGNVTAISIYANDQSSGCIILSGFTTATGLALPLHLLVTDSSGSPEISNVLASDSSSVYVTRKSASSTLLNAYDSPYFNQTLSGTPGSCTTLSEGTGTGEYRIGQVTQESYALESSILNLIKIYDSDYSSVKSKFEVQNGIDFGFSFDYPNGTIVGTTDSVPESSGIYSESFPLTYISLNGSVGSGKLNVRIWQ